MSRSLLFSPIHNQTEAFSLCSSNFISIKTGRPSHDVKVARRRSPLWSLASKSYTSDFPRAVLTPVRFSSFSTVVGLAARASDDRPVEYPGGWNSGGDVLAVVELCALRDCC